MIKFKNVYKTYPNGVEALKDINITINDGEIIAIIGLSGSGKSTLLRTINKMHPISKGSLMVEGEEVSKLSGKKLLLFRHKIGMVFQHFNLVERQNVLKNVLASDGYNMNTFRIIFGLYSKEQKIRALESLQRVNLVEKAFTRVDDLSGGQRQRVALARTLMQNPKIILADEPVAALDPVTAKRIMSDFKRINEELGITVLLNMHHVDLALQYANRVIGIKDGCIVFDGHTNEVNKDVLAQIYGDQVDE